jgi:hypothetical protein
VACVAEAAGAAAQAFESCMPTAAYAGRGRARVLRVADGAGRALVEYPAPEETLLERLVRILVAGGVTVEAAGDQCTVSAGAETVWLSTSAPIAAEPTPAPKKKRTRRAKSVEAAGTAPEAESGTVADKTVAPAVESAAETDVSPAEPPTPPVKAAARKPRATRRKKAAAAESAAAGETAPQPKSDLFGDPNGTDVS